MLNINNVVLNYVYKYTSGSQTRSATVEKFVKKKKCYKIMTHST